MNLNVLEVESEEAAITLLSDYHPDIILMDLKMAKLEALRQQLGSLKII